MTDKLPPQLLALFQPRPPLRYIPPQDSAPEEKASSSSKIAGLAAFLPRLQENKDDEDQELTDSWLQKRDKARHEKQERLKLMQSDDFDGFKPDRDPKIKGDAVKTLFVGRLSYDVKDSDLEREFGQFGPIERIRIVKDDSSEKPKKSNRGYAFIVFEREKDMRAAYKATDGIRIRDRRVVVDVERGRMVPGWRPRRFGGGLGGRGYTKQAPAKPTFGGPSSFNSGFQGGPTGPGGGFRGRGGGGGGGGFRGGFRGGDRPGGYGGRGGIGYQGGGGGGGGGYGGRQGGYQNGAPPANAPSGPGGRGPGGYEDQRNGYGGGAGGYSRDRGYGGGRDSGRDRGYDDRDRHGGRRDDDYGSRKRYHDGDGYDDPRSKRRY